ncbi:hypothetical protein QMO14_13855 [Variovorax sp. CAN2819]|uniref:hypothetical protein n=1 Tax=Variovorax sp. CAN15 TaxID=3046727 RepID=UPI00264802D4|nr:hypothetical protein [Variovorax sp. CAN15]MDN6884683.1 hypothetical protein [Variovorax sp. CAN15]
MSSLSFWNESRLRSALGGVAAASLLVSFGVQAQAASATADFTVTLPVNAPVCTVTTAAADIRLTTGASAQQMTKSYLQSAGFDLNNKTNGGMFASPNFNQTATIKCTTPATPISSVWIRPTGDKALKEKDKYTWLLDTKGNKASGGNLYMSFEQLKVNDKDAFQSYKDGPYKTTFTTSNVADGTATVTWRPVVWADYPDTTPMGTPDGGSFGASGQIVVDY